LGVCLLAETQIIKNPQQLGVLSQWNTAGLEQVEPWENNKLPKYNHTMILKPNSVERIESGKFFKLSPNSADLLCNRINLKAL